MSKVCTNFGSTIGSRGEKTSLQELGCPVLVRETDDGLLEAIVGFRTGVLLGLL